MFSLAPLEIEARGEKAQLAYQSALKYGAVNVYRGRVLLIGQDRAGKTSLKKSLIGLPFNPKEKRFVLITDHTERSQGGELTLV